MTKELQNKSKKQEPIKRSKRIQEKNKKQNQESSDSDNESYYSSESEEENDMDRNEYRKFLNKIFPSKFLTNKIKNAKHLEKEEDDEDEEEYDSEYDSDDESESDYIETKNTSKNKKDKNKKDKKEKEKEKEKEKVKKDKDKDSKKDNKDNKGKKKENKKKDKKEKEEEDDDEYSDEDFKGKNKKFNIIFTIGGSETKEDDYFDEEYLDEDEYENESEWSTENEDDPVSSDSDSDKEELEEEAEDEKLFNKKCKNEKDKKEKEKDKKEKDKKEKDKKEKEKEKDKKESNEYNLIEKDKDKETDKDLDVDLSNNEILNTLKELQKKSNNNNNKIIEDCIKACEEKLNMNKKKHEKKMQKQKDRNERIFRQILLDKNTMNDFSFFKKMELTDQIKIIKELREINAISRIEKPYRLTLLESNIPTIYKASAMKKITSLRYMESGSGEFYKIKNWVDTFMRIPFNKIESLPICIEDGVERCHSFMESSQHILDEAVYGLNDAKMQIMQMLGQLITNPKAIGSAIAIHGPPGTGKTSLVKDGISKILNRPFSFIALGGATDSSFLEGHGYTYEGSTWGKIVQILIDSKCMNPVIYFDELDKISDTPKGEEIAGILTHLTDSTQNSQFHDKYFSDIDFDLSKCLFIFSYNDETKVNPILKDRMYRIQTKGYDKKQKTVIANQHLLPKIREQVRFNLEDIQLPDDSIHHIIDNYCDNEDGVRNLKRCLEIIHTKLNLYRLMRPQSNLFEQEMSIKVEFPFTVTKDIVDKLIKINKNENFRYKDLYI
jgi:ATP-dependent Lon protease